MEAVVVLSRLGLEDYIEAFPEWEPAQRCFSEHGISFLEQGYLEHYGEVLSIPREVTVQVVSLAESIEGSLLLKRLTWYFHHYLYHHIGEPLDRELVNSWPPAEKIAELAENAELFYLLVLLSGMSRMQELHQAYKIPPQIVSDTIGNIVVHLNQRLEHYHSQYSRWGLTPSHLYWSAISLRGECYRVGRLQFQFSPLRLPVRVFRHKKTYKVLAFSEGEKTYTSDGQVYSAKRNEEESFTTIFRISNDLITGNPVHPGGSVCRQVLGIPRNEWSPVMGPGALVLAIHIPGGSPLDHELCGEALSSARAFFSEHFRQKPYSAFTCSSWILDAQLADLLTPESNMVRFQEEFYLVPTLGDDRHLLRQVFAEEPDVPENAPRKTSLQRAVVECWQRDGLQARAGGAFLLPEDLNWGSKIYHTDRFPAELLAE